MVNLQVSGLSAESPERGLTFTARERELMQSHLAISKDLPENRINHYVLLGIPADLRDNAAVISNKADTAMTTLRNLQLSNFAAESQSLQAKVQTALRTLLVPAHKLAYDELLRRTAPELILVPDGRDRTRDQAALVVPAIIKKKEAPPSWLAKNWKTATGVAGTITTGIALAAAAIVSGAGNEKKETPATDPATPVVRTAAAGEGPRPSITKETVPPTEPVPTPKPTASAADVTPIALAPDNQPGISEASIQIPPVSPTFAVGFNPPEEQQEPARAVPKQPRSLGDLLVGVNPSTPPTNPPPVTQAAATEETQKQETQLVIDPAELKAKRAEINSQLVPGKFGLEKAKILRDLHAEPEILKDPTMLKAVIIEWFSAGKDAANVQEMDAAVNAMTQYPQLFTVQELERCRAITRTMKSTKMMNSTKEKDYKLPKNAEQRQQNARAFLALASEAAADGNPDQADEFLKHARLTAVLGNQDKQFTASFKIEGDIVQRQITTARSVKAAKDQLEKNPNDPEAHRILGEISYVDGSINEALAHLAQSNSKLSLIAKKTLSLLNSNNPNAKECFDTAFAWDAQSTPANSDATTRSIKRKLLEYALTTSDQNPPLTTAERVRANMWLKQNGGSVATNSTINTPAINGGNGGKVESAREPMRPKYVPKEAEWNPETRSWYYAVSTEKPISLRESMMYAMQHQAQLFVPDTESENAFVVGMLKRNGLGSVALGITKRPDGWFNPSGRQEYFKWNPGEPSGGQTELAAFLKVETGGWDDMNLEGDEFTAVVLEWPLKQK